VPTKTYYIVEVLETFTQIHELEALMVAGEQVGPPRTITIRNEKGNLIKFTNKNDAQWFAETHGDKVKYLGRR
jgi:hypothetical protein